MFGFFIQTDQMKKPIFFSFDIADIENPCIIRASTEGWQSGLMHRS